MLKLKTKSQEDHKQKFHYQKASFCLEQTCYLLGLFFSSPLGLLIKAT